MGALNYFLCVSLLGFKFCSTRKVEYSFTVRYFEGSPDGVKKQILGVNDQFPGPTIRATKGDILVVHVHNLIQTHEPTSIHWHGLDQFLSPFEDGPEGVTQCPIPYGVNMTYEFLLRQAGTYWWHSHHSSQYTDGCWGALIIDNYPSEIYSYHGEILITVNDWFHTSATELGSWYLSPQSEGNEPIPDSVLLNGHGIYPCKSASLTGMDCNPSRQGYRQFQVPRNRIIRIRLINTSSMANFYFSIDSHKLEVIETDGVDTVLVAPVDRVRISSAQRYSFLVRTNVKRLSLFWIRAEAVTTSYSLVPNSNKYPYAFLNNAEVKGILRYVNKAGWRDELLVQAVASSATQGRPASHSLYDFDFTNERNSLGSQNLHRIVNTAQVEASTSKLDSSVYSIPKPVELESKFIPSADESDVSQIPTITTDNSAPMSRVIGERAANNKNLPKTKPLHPALAITSNANDCRPYGSTSAPPSYDQLVTLEVGFFTDKMGVKRSGFNGISFGVGPIPVIYQIVLGNQIPKYNHPIRTPLGIVVQVVINNPNPTGHPFHLHGHTFWVVGSGLGIYNDAENRPNLTLTGVRRDTVTVGGNSWVAFRYRTDNPGPWLLHCHYNWHHRSGLAAVFIEGEDVMRTLGIRWLPDEGKRICKAGPMLMDLN